MLGKIISGLVGAFNALAGPLIAVAVGAFLVWGYDHSFNGWKVGFQIPFTKCCFIGIPPGIGPAEKQELVKANEDLALAEDNVKTLQRGIEQQNQSILDLENESEQKQKSLEKAIVSSSAERAKMLRLEAQVMRPLPTGSDCDRYRAADKQFLGALR